MCTFSIILALLVTLLVLGVALLLLGIKIDALEDSPNYSPKSARPYRACSYIIKFGMILTACGLIGFLGSASGVLAAMAFAVPKPTRVPSGSWFDHSHNVATTIPFGAIVPVDWRFMMPGEKYKCNIAGYCRALMLKAPVMQDIDLKFATYFVPTRLLCDKNEDIIAAAPNISALNLDNSSDPINVRLASPTFPYINFGAGNVSVVHSLAQDFVSDGSFDFDSLNTAYLYGKDASTPSGGRTNFSAAKYINYWRVGSLWDYLGFPVMSDDVLSSLALSKTTFQFDDVHLSLLPFKAYQSICNHFFIPDFQRRAFAGSKYIVDIASSQVGLQSCTPDSDDDAVTNLFQLRYSQFESDPYTCSKPSSVFERLNNASALSTPSESANIFNANTIRGIFALDEFARKVEYFYNDLRKEIKYMFGVMVSDKSALSPILVNAGSAPIGVSEIQNTSLQSVNSEQTSQSLGKMTSSFGKSYDTFEVEEHGVMMTCVWIRPRNSYMNRLSPMWSRFVDYASIPNPLFAEVGEVEQLRYEVDYQPFRWFYDSPSGDEHVNSVFGYNTRYVDMKYSPDVVSGDMRGSLKYWNTSRDFWSVDPIDYADIAPAAGVEFNLINGKYVGDTQPLNRIFTLVKDTPNVRPFQLQLRFHTQIWQQLPHIDDEM